MLSLIIPVPQLATVVSHAYGYSFKCMLHRLVNLIHFSHATLGPLSGNPPIFTSTARDESTACKRGLGRVAVARDKYFNVAYT